jgi:hypothetical protein
VIHGHDGSRACRAHQKHLTSSTLSIGISLTVRWTITGGDNGLSMIVTRGLIGLFGVEFGGGDNGISMMGLGVSRVGTL